MLEHWHNAQNEMAGRIGPNCHNLLNEHEDQEMQLARCRNQIANCKNAVHTAVAGGMIPPHVGAVLMLAFDDQNHANCIPPSLVFQMAGGPVNRPPASPNKQAAVKDLKDIDDHPPCDPTI